MRHYLGQAVSFGRSCREGVCGVGGGDVSPLGSYDGYTKVGIRK